jgi:hypothetical protein
LDISGSGGQGGTADFLIHLDISGVGHDGQGGQRSRSAYGIPSGDELDPASATLPHPHGLGLWHVLQRRFIASALGQFGISGNSKSNASGGIAIAGQPQGLGLLQRLQGPPPSNFSKTLPRDRPIKYPTINKSATPNKISIGDTFKTEAILFCIMVFYAGRL